MEKSPAAVVPEDGLSLPVLITGVVITLAMAAIAGVVHYAGSDAGERSVTGSWGSFAFTAVIAAPAVAAVIGTRARPWVLGAAGAVQIPMLFLSFSPLFFPLLAPAAIFITQAASMARGRHRSQWQLVAAAVSALGLFTATACLVVHQDPVTWTTATESGSSSDVITATESALAFACIALAIVAARAAPRDDVTSR